MQKHEACALAPYETDFVTGCAFCIRRETIERIGLMDPQYFFYYEDVDWCFRARQVGYKVMVVPRATMWHKVSGTMTQEAPATTYYMTRNHFLFIAKNLHGIQRLRMLASAGMREFRSIASERLRRKRTQRRASRQARLIAVRDALLQQWGKMSDVAARVCFPGS